VLIAKANQYYSFASLGVPLRETSSFQRTDGPLLADPALIFF
jgi:hypothetical protein